MFVCKSHKHHCSSGPKETQILLCSMEVVAFWFPELELREGVPGTYSLLNACHACHLQVPFRGFDYSVFQRHWDWLPFLRYVSLCPNTSQYSPADKPAALQVPAQDFFFLSSWTSQQGALTGYHPLLGQSR